MTRGILLATAALACACTSPTYTVRQLAVDGGADVAAGGSSGGAQGTGGSAGAGGSLEAGPSCESGTFAACGDPGMGCCRACIGGRLQTCVCGGACASVDAATEAGGAPGTGGFGGTGGASGTGGTDGGLCPKPCTVSSVPQSLTAKPGATDVQAACPGSATVEDTWQALCDGCAGGIANATPTPGGGWRCLVGVSTSCTIHFRCRGLWCGSSASWCY